MDRFDIWLEISYLQLEGSEARHRQFMSRLRQDKTQTIQDIQDKQELDRLDRKIKRLYDRLEQDSLAKERKAAEIQRGPRRRKQVKSAQSVKPAHSAKSVQPVKAVQPVQRDQIPCYTPRTPYRLLPCKTYDSSEPSTDFEEAKHLAKALLASRHFSVSNQQAKYEQPNHESPPFFLSEYNHEYNLVRYSATKGFGFHPFDPGGAHVEDLESRGGTDFALYLFGSKYEAWNRPSFSFV